MTFKPILKLVTAPMEVTTPFLVTMKAAVMTRMAAFWKPAPSMNADDDDDNETTLPTASPTPNQPLTAKEEYQLRIDDDMKKANDLWCEDERFKERLYDDSLGQLVEWRDDSNTILFDKTETSATIVPVSAPTGRKAPMSLLQPNYLRGKSIPVKQHRLEYGKAWEMFWDIWEEYNKETGSDDEYLDLATFEIFHCTIPCEQDEVEYCMQYHDLPDGLLDELFGRLDDALAANGNDDDTMPPILPNNDNDNTMSPTLPDNDDDDDNTAPPVTSDDDSDDEARATDANDANVDSTVRIDTGGADESGVLQPSPIWHTSKGFGSMYISDPQYPTHTVVRRSCRVAERSLYKVGMYKC